MNESKVTESTDWTRVVIFALATFSVVPILLCDFLPLFDYPFHLARMHILAEYNESVLLQEAYIVDFGVLPNLAMDVIVQGLSAVIPVTLASKTFVVLTMLGTLTGLAYLHRVLHSQLPGVELLFGAALLYNWIFYMGFLNYLFGLAVLLHAIAWWISAQDKNVAIRITVGTLLGLLLFFSHLVAFVLFAIAIGGTGLYRSLWGRQWNFGLLSKEALIGIAVCFLPALLYLVFSPNADDLAGAIYFQSLGKKVEALIRTPASSNMIGDLLFYAGAGVGLAAFLSFKKVEISMILLPTIVIVFLAYLFAPVGTETGYHLDDRLPLVIGLLLIAAMKIESPQSTREWAVVAVIGVCFLARIGLTTSDWLKWQDEYQNNVAAFSAIKTPAVVYTALEKPNNPNLLRNHYKKFRPPTHHLGCYAALLPDVFVPAVYANRRLQPLGIRDEYSLIRGEQGNDPFLLTSAQDLQSLITQLEAMATTSPDLLRYAYLYVRAGSEILGKVGSDRIVTSGDNFTLLRLDWNSS